MFQATQADFHIFHMASSDLAAPMVQKHPELLAFVEKFSKDPKIKAWLDKRPKTPL
jgi:hypothetical protein